MLRRTFSLGFLSIICLVNFACSSKPADRPDLGKVTGVVVLDGTPVEGIEVQFTPEKGRGSQGVTDGEGKYELNYLQQVKGAVIGKHKVIIKTLGEEDDSDPDAPVVEEKIPAKYNTKSTLTAEVEAGENEIDFQLISE